MKVKAITGSGHALRGWRAQKAGVSACLLQLYNTLKLASYLKELPAMIVHGVSQYYYGDGMWIMTFKRASVHDSHN